MDLLLPLKRDRKQRVRGEDGHAWTWLLGVPLTIVGIEWVHIVICPGADQGQFSARSSPHYERGSPPITGDDDQRKLYGMSTSKQTSAEILVVSRPTVSTAWSGASQPTNRAGP